MPESKRMQVLMVEDQGFDAMLLRKLLEGPSVGVGRIDHAGNLADAIALLERNFYDAVLLDLGLPDADGVDAVRRLCTQFPALAVVVLTGRDEVAIGLEAMAAGAQDKLDKVGLDAAQLAHSLHYAIARQRLDEDTRQSAEDHRVLFENNPFPLLVHELNTLRFLAVNHAAVLQYGYTRTEFLNRSLPDIWPPEDAGVLMQAMRGPSDATLHEGGIRHRRKDGSVFDVEINIQSINFRGRQARMVLARDTTVRRRAVRALEVSEMRFRKLFQYSLGLICTHDLDGVLLSINPAAARAIGYPMAELLGRNLAEFMPASSRPAFSQYLERVVEHGDATGRLHLIARDGTPHIWEFHNVLDRDATDEPYVLGHAQDVTESRHHERQLREQNIRDPLTGCHNRRYLAERAAAMGIDESCGCIVIDLDHFKQINDTFGHQRGDEVLVGFGHFLMQHARPADLVVRMGGDEFALLLAGADAAFTEAFARMLRERGSSEAPSRFSVGWAARLDGELLESMLSRADALLYAGRAGNRT